MIEWVQQLYAKGEDGKMLSQAEVSQRANKRFARQIPSEAAGFTVGLVQKIVNITETLPS